MVRLTSPEAAEMYERQATFMQLMDDYLSGRLSTEEYADARQRFFRERFPKIHRADSGVTVDDSSARSDRQDESPLLSKSRWLRD